MELIAILAFMWVSVLPLVIVLQLVLLMPRPTRSVAKTSIAFGALGVLAAAVLAFATGGAWDALRIELMLGWGYSFGLLVFAVVTVVQGVAGEIRRAAV